MTKNFGSQPPLPDPERPSITDTFRAAYAMWPLPIFLGVSLAVHLVVILLYLLTARPVVRQPDKLIEIDLRDSEKPKPKPKPKPLIEAKKPLKPELKRPTKPLPRVAMRPQPNRPTPVKIKPVKVKPVTVKPVKVKPPKVKPVKIKPPKVKPPKLVKIIPPKEKIQPKPLKVAQLPPTVTIQPPKQPKRVVPVTKPPVVTPPVKPQPAIPSPGKNTPVQGHTTKPLPGLPSAPIARLPRDPALDTSAPRPSGRERHDEPADSSPGANTPDHNIKSHRQGPRPDGGNQFNDNSTGQTNPGGQGNAAKEPLPGGDRAGRLYAGDPGLTPGRLENRAYGAGILGGGSTGAGNSSGGSRRGTNPELAGTDGAGGVNLPRGVGRRGGGGGRTNPNVFAYNNPNDSNTYAMGPRGDGPGSGGGTGAGRNGGAGGGSGHGAGAGGSLDLGVIRSRPGTGLGGGVGANIGGGPGRSRGGSGEMAGGGGSGGGIGGGHGSGLGGGRGNGGGGGRRRPLYAGVPFGDPGGGAGNAHGGGGTGGGPGGPGNGTRIARGGGVGDGGGDGSGHGPGGGVGNGSGFGRGPGGGIGSGRGHGNGIGIGDGPGGNGSGGSGRGNRDGDGEAGEGDGGAARVRKLGIERARLEREREAGQLMIRGIFAPGLKAQFFQDTAKHPDTPDATFGPGHAIDWPVFTDLKSERTDKIIDFNWGTAEPAKGMRNVFWSARWKGNIFVPKDDTYTFFFDRLDDAGRLVLNGEEIIKVWKVQQSTPSSRAIELKRGSYPIVVEYVQGPATEASISLSWKSSSFDKETVGIYEPKN